MLFTCIVCVTAIVAVVCCIPTLGQSVISSHSLPRARMREAGLSNRFCPSVSRLSSVRRIKLNFCHIDPHKPSKGSQTIANSKKLLYVSLTEVKALRLGCFSSYFLLFVTFGPTSSTSQYACCCIYGKRSLPHLGYGRTRTQYTR